MSNVENLMSAAHLFKVFPALLHFCGPSSYKMRKPGMLLPGNPIGEAELP